MYGAEPGTQLVIDIYIYITIAPARLPTISHMFYYRKKLTVSSINKQITDRCVGMAGMKCFIYML